MGPNFAHLLTVRAEGADPPPLTVSLTEKKTVCFLTTSLKLTGKQIVCSNGPLFWDRSLWEIQ